MAEVTATPPRSGPPVTTPRSAARPISAVRTYLILQQAAWRNTFAYRASLWTLVLGSVALQGTQLLFIGVLLHQFGVINGWTTPEIALLYGLRLSAHGVCTTTFGQHSRLDGLLRNGEYDRFLLRPANPFVQLITWRFNLGTVGDLALGLGILITAAQLVVIDWTIGRVLLAVLAVIGGGLVEAGVMILISGLAFRLRTTWSAKVTVDTMFTDFGAYPLPIFGPAGVFALTFAIPLAFIAYLPCTVILARTSELLVPTWLAVIAPLAGPVLLVCGYAFFTRQSRAYDSPGA